MKKYRHTVHETATLLQALDKLNKLSGGTMALFVVDGEERVKGSLTDGDVRRALLKGHSTDDAVAVAMNTSFRYVDNCKDSPHEVVSKLRDMRACGISMVPVLDRNRVLTDIIDLNVTATRLPVKAILMAGGKGERLRPMTLTVPKPLLEIENKAIIDYNVEALARAGVTDITIITRYLAEKIHAHFRQPVGGINVKCIEEKQPLGTIGGAALSLTSDEDDSRPVIVMNSDLLTTISFEDMYMRHIDEHADITVAVIPYTLSVPYAILATENNKVSGIEEKPTYTYFANAGIYMINNGILASMPEGKIIDATDLIADAISRGGKVVCHPVDGTWIDIGSPADFQRASEMMRHHRNLTRRRQ